MDLLSVEPDDYLPDGGKRRVDQAGDRFVHGDRVLDHRQPRDPGPDDYAALGARHGRRQVADLGARGSRFQWRSDEQLSSAPKSYGRCIPDPDHQREGRLLEQIDQILDVVAERTLRVELDDGGLRTVGGGLPHRFSHKADDALIERPRHNDDVEWGGLLCRSRYDRQGGAQGQEEEDEPTHGRYVREPRESRDQSRLAEVLPPADSRQDRNLQASEAEARNSAPGTWAFGTRDWRLGTRVPWYESASGGRRGVDPQRSNCGLVRPWDGHPRSCGSAPRLTRGRRVRARRGHRRYAGRFHGWHGSGASAARGRIC